MPKEKRRFSRSPSRRKRSRSRSPKKHNSKKCESNQFEETESQERKRATKINQEFSFEDYKKDLDTLFFTDRDVIKKSTPQYEEFWKFFNKYQLMRKKQGINSWIPPKTQPCNKLGIPTVYHRSFMINFGLNLPPPDKLLSRIPSVDYSERKSARPRLTREQLMEFHQIILLYLEFLQREKMVKLKKLRESQQKLPIAQFKDEIVKAVFEKQVIIIAGDTGCGKSTQVPQYLLQAGFSRIACTQPRRIACIALSKRVAYETLNEFGSTVGYQIRFEKSKTQATRIVFVTEGLVLRQISTDPTLSDYDIIVLDEVHERHLAGDFLLGVMKCLVQSRKDLKLILMSATINIGLFQQYFQGQAPVIQVPGRLFPIQVQYKPIAAEERVTKTGKMNPSPYLRILQLIDGKYKIDERGDLLIFLSGMNEITTVEEVVREYAQQNQRWIVLPLHSTLSVAEQDKVFDYPPEGVRKCIIATNIAETSITLDGVRFVVDSGKVKEMSHDPISKLQRLQEFWISRASAEQRKGRAGRTGPGVCFRLYSEKEYGDFAAYATPEIQRVPLDSMILQMISMGLPDARLFPFIEPPSGDAVENSITTLKEKGALTIDEKLTTIGKCLAGLPVDITLGKMLLMGSIFGQVEAVLALAAALSVQTPFTNRAYRDSDCESARKDLDSDHGDPLTLLNAYKAWLEIKATNQGHTSRKWCKKRGLEEQRFYEMTKLRQQFRHILSDAGLLPGQDSKQNTSSSQRAVRHGQLQHLRSLKRDFIRSGQRKRKVLKLGEDIEDMDDDDDEENGEQMEMPTGANIDIKDVEFRLQHDQSTVRSLLRGVTSAATSHQDLMLLKLILASGLSPQVAIADEFNNYKSTSDQLFHTRAKPFTALHPMGVFANHPEALQLLEHDTIQVPGFVTKLPVSSKHQVLMYVTLLETNKLYLMNAFRMPAAQTLLLFSQSIDTNGDFARIVCDSWLELQFVDAAAAQSLLLRACQLRYRWNDLLMLRLDPNRPLREKDVQKLEQKMKRMQKDLHYDLIAFTQTQTLYTIKRLLAADLKIIYRGCALEDAGIPDEKNPSEINPFWPEFLAVTHPRKGGIQMADFLVYGCLEEPDFTQDYLSTPWACPICELNFYLTGLGRLRHQVQCQKTKELMEEGQGEQAETSVSQTGYFCPDCRSTLELTGIDLLRHQKKHQQEKSKVEED